jgi:hypothetical protein
LFQVKVLGGRKLVETQPLKTVRYRDTARKIRRAVDQTNDSDIRRELLVLADRFDRLADHAERQTKPEQFVLPRHS